MLVGIVVGINIMMAIAGFYVAWRLWRLRSALAQLTQALIQSEQAARSLPTATVSLMTGELGLGQTRLAYRRLQAQIQQILQIIGVLQTIQRYWRYGRSRS